MAHGRRRPGATFRPARGSLAAAALLTTLLTAPAAALAPGAAAATSTAASEDAEHYVTAVRSIEPAVAGLEVRASADGDITLTNRTGGTVVVEGYAGEDYLRITAEKVERNVRALTSALTGDVARTGLPEQLTRTGGEPPEPKWVQVGPGPTATWSDFRTTYTAARPPVVTQDPHSEHRVFEWAIQVRADDAPVLIRGDVTWTGIPWLTPLQIGLFGTGGLLLLAVAIALLRRRANARKAARRRGGGRRARRNDEDDLEDWDAWDAQRAAAAGGLSAGGPLDGRGRDPFPAQDRARTRAATRNPR